MAGSIRTFHRLLLPPSSGRDVVVRCGIGVVHHESTPVSVDEYRRLPMTDE
jgi:hypothetical protein